MGRRGKSLLSIDGYTFYAHRTRASKTQWLCSTNYTRGCRARIITVENEIVKYNNSHNHSIL